MDVMEHEKIIGWHGTTRESSEKIMQAGFRFEEYIFGKSNQRLPNDLGAGIYFFVEDDHLENPQSLAYKYVLNYKNRELNKTGTTTANKECVPSGFFAPYSQPVVTMFQMTKQR